MIPVAEQIEEVEALIADFRWARDERNAREHRTYHVLKIIASDLRARLPGSAGEARDALERRYREYERIRALLGAEVGFMQEMVGRWPVVMRALEMAATNGDAEETRG